MSMYFIYSLPIYKCFLYLLYRVMCAVMCASDSQIDSLSCYYSLRHPILYSHCHIVSFMNRERVHSIAYLYYYHSHSSHYITHRLNIIYILYCLYTTMHIVTFTLPHTNKLSIIKKQINQSKPINILYTSIYRKYYTIIVDLPPLAILSQILLQNIFSVPHG